MAEAVISDIASVRGVSVVTSWDDRLRAPHHNGVDLRRISGCEEEHELFRSMLTECDAALLIAPECGGILEQRLREAESIAGGEMLLNCRSEAAGLCGDKLRLAERLSGIDVATPYTERFDAAASRPAGRWVVKPRYGAGCEQTYVLTASTQFEPVAMDAEEFVIQPFVEGIPLSNAVLINTIDGGRTLLPLGRQEVQGELELSYQGGELPWHAAEAADVNLQAAGIIERILAQVSGLSGYVGFDWIWNPTEERLWLIEVNPRLTTSYVGYRQLYGAELIKGLWYRGAATSCLPLIEDVIRFTPSGIVSRGPMTLPWAAIREGSK